MLTIAEVEEISYNTKKTEKGILSAIYAKVSAIKKR
jgi:hypothetical protein